MQQGRLTFKESWFFTGFFLFLGSLFLFLLLFILIPGPPLAHPNLYQFLKLAQVPLNKPESYYGLALVLGGEEIKMSTLLSLYAMLNNEGRYRPIRYLLNAPQESGVQLLTPEASWITEMMLRQNLRPDEIASAQSQPVTVAWKTGTSSAFRDAWSIGIFGPYVLGVWFGHFNNRSNPALVGRTMAAPLMFQIIDRIHSLLPPWPEPEKQLAHLHVAEVTVCAGSGMLPTQACPLLDKTWFIPGVSPHFD